MLKIIESYRTLSYTEYFSRGFLDFHLPNHWSDQANVTFETESESESKIIDFKTRIRILIKSICFIGFKKLTWNICPKSRKIRGGSNPLILNGGGISTTNKFTAVQCFFYPWKKKKPWKKPKNLQIVAVKQNYFP